MRFFYVSGGFLTLSGLSKPLVDKFYYNNLDNNSFVYGALFALAGSAIIGMGYTLKKAKKESVYKEEIILENIEAKLAYKKDDDWED